MPRLLVEVGPIGVASARRADQSVDILQCHAQPGMAAPDDDDDDDDDGMEWNGMKWKLSRVSNP